MPTVQSLTQQIDTLNRSVSFWNKAIIILMFSTAVVAIGLFIAQRIVTSKNESLVSVEAQLSTLKDTENEAKLAEVRASAASATERAEKVESGNIHLRIDLQNATAEANKRQTELEVAQRKTAEAQARAAKAQKDAAWYVSLVVKNLNPRLIYDRKLFLDTLSAVPKGTAEIWYEPNDPEAREFAENIEAILGGTDGAGWRVSPARPLPLEEVPPFRALEPVNVLQDLRLAASTGLAIGANILEPEDFQGKTQLGALKRAIDLGTGGWNISGVSGHWEEAYPSLTDGHYVIVVGHRSVNLPVVHFPQE